jgi:hypothetical protein
MGSGIRRAVPLAAIAALALAGCGDDETAGDERTLTYFQGKDAQFEQFGERGRRGSPAPGGGFTLLIPLEDGDGNPVGELNAFCIVTEYQFAEETEKGDCSGTVDLPDGQLNIQIGGEIPEGNVTGSIVGGNGDYAGATGTYESVEQKGQPAEDTFTFTLP